MAVGGTGMIIIVTGTLELWNSIISAATTSGYSQAKGKIETKIYESKENINNDSKLEKLW
jgi:preprotein translocase subunit SecY